ncbi:MAG TPA: SusC/RagA family TonB-linked outer membrane protein [Bacteroidales bacterium]|nr:SusC/RagA family TonB-linked outer membrane protein [Bacteroidales bacterium]
MNVFLRLKKAAFSRYVLREALCILFFTCICGYSFAAAGNSVADRIKISGVVVDNTKTPVIGANVVEKGTVNGTATDTEGKFTIEVSGPDAIIVVSFLGYGTQEVPVGSTRYFTVTLEDNVSLLDEVVVIGYGTQKKADVTSSVASIKSDDFKKGAVADAGQLIQGKVAGLQISLPTGNPTASTSVLLRGFSTLMGSTSPLILIDGVPGSFGTVAPEDIESIDVLKDGSSTAIYGTRGTNGVIIITTKGLKTENNPTIEYSGYVSSSTWLKRPDFLNAKELREKWADGFSCSGANDKDYNATTNWLDEISRTAISQVNNLTFRAGTSKNGYLVNLGYEDRQGVIKTSGAKNMRARLEMTHTMFDDRLVTNVSVIANEENTKMPNDWDYIYRLACIQNPTQPVFNTDGTYFERDVYNYDNPVTYLRERIGMSRSRNLRATGSMEYKITKGLSVKGMYTRKGQSYLSGAYYTKKDVSTTEGSYNGYASRYMSDFIYDMSELSANWTKTINGVHHITAVAGYNYESNTSENFGVSNSDFQSDNFTYNRLELGAALWNGDSKNKSMSSHKENSKLIGLFSRVTYNYSDRYLLMVSLRHEGSSKFGEDHKWGNFPGISAGWRINNEDFMRNITWLNNLKLRAGFGITGIDINDPYKSLASLDYMEPFLYDGKYINTLESDQNANPNLRWEKKLEYNLGLDFSVFNDRINGSLDFYQRDTRDGIYNYKVPSPPNQYSYMLANVCKIRNRGLEVMINAVPVKTSDFSWNTSVTYSYNKNKLLSLQNDEFQMSTDYFDTGYTGEPIQTSTHRVKEGWAIGNFYGLKSVGLNSAGIWIVERFNTDAEGKRTSKFYDVAQSTSIQDDGQVLGNGVPKAFLNWNNNVSYKNFDLSVTMRGAFGFQILNYQKMYYGNPTIQYNVLNCAFDKLDVVDPATGKKTGDKARISDSQRYLSYYIEDGDFWKIDNVTLGYTFNTKNIKYIKNLHVYASVSNLATITGYSGLDPEVSMTYSSNGYDPGTDSRDKYPTLRSYTLGLNMTF